MCAIICGLQLAALILTWNGWWSFLPIIANIAATIGGYTYDAKKIRFVGMFINSPLWIIYNVLVGSFAGIIDEVVTEASIIISIYRHGWNNLNLSQNEE